MEDIDRFWSYVDRSGGPDACWPWLRSQNRQGYGRFYPSGLGGRYVYAARWLLGHLRGYPLAIAPRGLEESCHRCDNPPCCNPAHLYVGTRKQNLADAVQRSRLWMLRRTHCPQGHPYDQNNTYLSPRSGSRKCRTCRSEAARNANVHRLSQRSHCRAGHPLDGENVLLCQNGTRKCRICDAARVAKMAESRRRV